jgi:hypothetical protein
VNKSVNKNTMWQTGNISDFSNRLHQLPTDTDDLITGFAPEAQNNYTGITYTGLNYIGEPTTGDNYSLRQKWNKEFNLQYYRFTNDGQMLASGRWFY